MKSNSYLPILAMTLIIVSIMYSCAPVPNEQENDYATLTVIVKDAQNGSLLDNVTLKIAEKQINAKYKGNGEYEFDNLEYVKYDIEVSKAEYITKTVNVPITLKVQTTTIELNPTPQTEDDFTGTISLENSTNFEKAYLLLISENHNKYYAETESPGNSFIFKDLPYGQYSLSIYAKGFNPKSISIKHPTNSGSPHSLNMNAGSVAFDVPFIDMGAIEARTISSFSVLAPIDNVWTITYDKDKYNWITEISPLNGSGRVPVVLKIDRNPGRLKSQNSYVPIVVTSETDGSRDELLLIVSETGNGVNLTDLVIQKEKIEIIPTMVTIPCEIYDPELISKGYEFGVIYSDNKDNISYVSDGSWEAGVRTGNSYVVNLKGLNPGKSYWSKAIARHPDNQTDNRWGKETVHFVSGVSSPTLSTPIIIEKHIETGTATFETSITFGDMPCIEKGFVYGHSPEVSIDDNIGQVKSKNIIGGIYRDVISNIQQGKYYVRAYASDGDNTIHSNYTEFDFTAKIPQMEIPVLVSKDISLGTATFESTITIGDLSCVERGFVYGTNRNPRLDDNFERSIKSGSGNGEYSGTFSNIPEGKYYVSAYAVTSDNTPHYSLDDAELNLFRINPVVETREVIEFGYDYAKLEGYMQIIGDPVYDECGFIYTRTWTTDLTRWKELPVTKNKTTGAYSYQCSGLSHGTKYYVRAYAKVDNKYFYGDEISFETEAYYKQIPNTNVIMQMYDISTGSKWDEANMLCAASKAGEYSSGWRLPTIGELSVMYSMYSANVLAGNFCTDLTNCSYWSSTYWGILSGEKYYETYEFGLGMSFWAQDYLSRSVRCVRDIP